MTKQFLLCHRLKNRAVLIYFLPIFVVLPVDDQPVVMNGQGRERGQSTRCYFNVRSKADMTVCWIYRSGYDTRCYYNVDCVCLISLSCHLWTQGQAEIMKYDREIVGCIGSHAECPVRAAGCNAPLIWVFILVLYILFACSLQCFDAVGWAAGRASGLETERVYSQRKRWVREEISK